MIMRRAAATPNTLTHEEKKEENHLQYIVHMFFNTQTQIKKSEKNAEVNLSILCRFWSKIVLMANLKTRYM